MLHHASSLPSLFGLLLNLVLSAVSYFKKSVVVLSTPADMFLLLLLLLLWAGIAQSV